MRLTTEDRGGERRSPPFWRQRWFLLVALMVGAGVVGAITYAVGDDESEGAATGDDADESAADEPAEDEAAGEATVIESRTYAVPTEIEPGVYRVAGYWARLDEGLEIIDSDLVSPSKGFTLVVVGEGDSYVEVTGEAAALPDVPAVDPIARGFTDGTYLVGADIRPGRYRVSATAGGIAYAARLDEALEIIDSDLDEGSVTIAVDSSDFAFTFNGALERSG